VRYLTDKAARVGIQIACNDDAYSTKTCSQCGKLAAASPRGRRSACAGCGVTCHRDVNGSSNICAKGACGDNGQVQAENVKYPCPIEVAPPTRANVANAG
jgi:transposase